MRTALFVKRSIRPVSRWGRGRLAAPSFRVSSNTAQADENKKDPSQLQEWRGSVLKGTGQVIFLNSPESGALILASLLVGDPYLAYLATLGTVTSTATARALKLDTTALNNGLWSFNGCLMGCMSAVFVSPESAAWGTLSTLAGATTATAVTAFLPHVLPAKMPQWTFAFNAVALTQLARVQPFLPDTTTTSSEVAVEAVSTTAVTLSSIACTPLVGLSQIFVVESPVTGLGIAASIAMYSPLLTTHALVGSSVGALVGMGLGAPVTEITAGLWSYNSALTSMGVGVFFCKSRPTWALSISGAATTAVVLSGLKVAFLSLAASPCLTLPFCLTMSGCWTMSRVVPSLVLAANPHSPEQNQEAQK